MSMQGWIANHLTLQENWHEVIDSLQARLPAPLLGIMPFMREGEPAQQVNFSL
ncbi:MAG: hypothetical protein R3E08_00575 [Thiotrichaceae bacterium]